MGRLRPFPGTTIQPGSESEKIMPSRVGNWMIAVGILVALIGLCVLPAAFGDRGDNNLLGVAGTLFGMGALAAAAGFFLNGQALHSKDASGAPSKASANARKPRGACDLCRTEMPVVNCKVHQLHLCGKCLAEHYDFRSCVYVPSTRRTETKLEKAMGARASRS
jgi:hypothetical protein